MDDTIIKINIESKLMNLPILRKTIRGLCSFVIENEKIFQDIELCMNEALSNIIHHSYQNQPGHEIEIIVTIYPKEFVFQIIDAGLRNFKEPLANVNQEIDVENIDSIPETGRGLFLMKQLMDEVVYKSEENKNVLTLKKRF